MKSKEFIIERGTRNRASSSTLFLKYLNGVAARWFCYEAFRKIYGVKFKEGERKRIKITVEELK